MTKIPFTHITQSRILSFSKKIECYANNFIMYDNISEIFYEKEKYNIALLIAYIIKGLIFPNNSKEAFMLNLENYNKNNKTALLFEDFFVLYWIRIIHDEIILPGVIAHNVWSINNIKENKIIENLPDNKKNMILCLADYAKNQEEPYITKKTVKSILKLLNLDIISIAFLLDNNILEYNTKNENYYWRGQLSYQEQLENEVSALIWILLLNEYKEHEIAFKRFIYLADKAKLSFKGVFKYISKDNKTILYEQAIKYIENENDLIISGNEFEKIRLDLQLYTNVDLNHVNSNVNFKCNSIYSLYELIEQLDNRKRNDYFPQKTKYYVNLLLHIILQYELESISEKKYIVKLLTDLERPSIILIIKEILPRLYPNLIPYLISCTELIPFAFKILDNIQFRDNIISSDISANNKYEKDYKLKNELWIEFYEIALNHVAENFNSNNDRINEFSEAISKLFLYTADKIYGNYYNIAPSIEIHLNAMQERYDSIMHIFQIIKTKFNTINNGIYKRSYISYYLIPYIINNLKENINKNTKQYNNFLEFHTAGINLLTDLLEIALKTMDNGKTDFNELLKNSIFFINEYICNFLTVKEIQIIDYYFNIKPVEADIAFDVDMLNKVNWSLLILLMKKYDILNSFNDIISEKIVINKQKNQFDKENRNQYYRLRLFLKIMLYSYIKLQNDSFISGFTNELIEEVKTELEESIIEYAVFYSKDEIIKGRIDIFDDYISIDKYKDDCDIQILLFSATNNFPIEKQKSFINSLFSDSINLKRMLIGVKNIDDEEIRNIIDIYINKINIDAYIDSCFTVTQWEETLIEAINSDKYWHFAEQLNINIQNHYKDKNYDNEQISLILYQVELSLALKNKDFEKLENVEYKRKVYNVNDENNPDDIKRYFTARYYIEITKEYDKAIKILKELTSKFENNLRYALMLFKTRFCKTIDTNEFDLIDEKEIIIAWNEWQEYIKRNTDKIKASDNIIKMISLYSIPNFILQKDNINFDLSVNNITNEIINYPLLIKLIYDFYMERKMEAEAVIFIKKINNYYNKNDIIIPAYINEIITKCSKDELLVLKNSFNEIIRMYYKNIPFVTPTVINDKNEIRMFILNETIKAIKQLQDRIKALHEDNYTDLIQSILLLRFQFYGWSITEHPNRGKSETGKQAGKPDLIIKWGDEDIALIEAMVLCGGDFEKTKKHILKCFKYSDRLDQYYIIIYYKGEKENFLSSWDSYKKNVSKIEFPDNKGIINKEEPFIDLEQEFDNVQSFKIAKTLHNNNCEMFHVMADLS